MVRDDNDDDDNYDNDNYDNYDDEIFCLINLIPKKI